MGYNKLEVIDPGFVNTREFSREARTFLLNERQFGQGFYCPDPPGTPGYHDYWQEQTKRCIEGYSVGGVRITGPHYYYLNFNQMLATIKEENRKRMTFPSFLDLDYHFFHEYERARQEGQGLIIVKARRKGFSYKTGSLSSHMYNFFVDSKTIIGAYLREFSESTMQMSLDYLNFVNKHTAWYKRRNPDRQDYVKARFKQTIKGKEAWYGYQSEIRSLTFKDNFSAAIGKSADLMIWEECGKFPNLIESYMITAPVFRDGERMIGTPILFGTGGDMEGGTNDFAKMFYNPEQYWLRPFENVWDEGAEGTPCGFFVSDTWYKPMDNKDSSIIADDGTKLITLDEDGNSNHAAAKIFLEREREIQKGAKDRRSWEKYITQYPLTPREAFLKISANMFPTAELSAWLGKVETTKELRDAGKAVDLLWDGSGVTATENPDLFPIKDFPIADGESTQGAIVIYEEPWQDADTGITPPGLYLAGTDPYDQDASGTSSLGSTFIYKTFNQFGETYDRIVAEYTGRPETSKEYYENLLKLLTYYNCQTLYENQLTGLKSYFEQKGKLHFLKKQPQIIKSMVKNSNVSRGYGIHMPTQIKKQAEIYVRDWLLTSRGHDDDGNEILNLHTILSVPLLKELIQYDPDNGNYDRVISLMLCIIHSHENYDVELKRQDRIETGATAQFFKKQLFKKSNSRPNNTRRFTNGRSSSWM